MKKFLLLLLALSYSVVYAQEVIIKQIETKVKSKQVMCTAKVKCKSPLLSKFYADNKYSLIWVKDNQLSSNGQAMVMALESANMDGFDPRAYHTRQIEQMLALLAEAKDVQDPNLLINLDLTISDGMLLYIHNMVNGWQDGSKLYPSWPIAKKKVNLLEVANKLVHTDDMTKSILEIAPKFPGYAKLREKLGNYYQVAENGGWEEIPDGDVLQKGSNGDRVALLQKRLYISGELSEIDDLGKFDSAVEKAVIKFQENNGLDDDGTVGQQTLNALNVSVGSRIRQIELNMDRMRFLPDDYPSNYVMVNVPDYSLVAMEDNKVKLFSPVVVGKPDHKTCILNSQISTIEVNPFWNVPFSIASKEILPEVKANPKILSDLDMKVYTVTGNKYSEVDPKTVDWKKIESSNLNFRFRQNPGSENALGKLKFIFTNNCSIYLHDSLYTELFDETKRSYSHGCIRVGQPFDLAALLLDKNKDWSNKQFNSDLESGVHKFVKLDTPMQLYIVYITAWYDDDEDFVQFRDDIYHFDKLSQYPLYLRKQVVKRSNGQAADAAWN